MTISCTNAEGFSRFLAARLRISPGCATWDNWLWLAFGCSHIAFSPRGGEMFAILWIKSPRGYLHVVEPRFMAELEAVVREFTDQVLELPHTKTRVVIAHSSHEL